MRQFLLLAVLAAAAASLCAAQTTLTQNTYDGSESEGRCRVSICLCYNWGSGRRRPSAPLQKAVQLLQGLHRLLLQQVLHAQGSSGVSRG